ncbi:beta-glucosidase [Caballeronia sp. AZ10_KS36]|uniref:beta-glucosidase n=1 Tax=Caballeronia sp. AZ10_KS36 TaxID=2921757 RepID=UPI0020278CE2|nr:beta-glucosidase [Caballeronia sp. AZ10_KS36]
MKNNAYIKLGICLVSLIVSACGGGSDGTPSSVNNAAVDPVSVVNIATNPASVSGTSIPPAASITDSSGAIWTVKSGVIYRANLKAGFSQDVILLLWYAGKIYQENVKKGWWVWQNNNWVASADPRPTTTASSSTSTSLTATGTGINGMPFFGVNEHYAYGGVYQSIPLSTQASTMADLGTTGVRQDVHGYDQIDALANTVIPGLGSKVTVMPLINAYPWDDPTLNGRTPTEASAYTYAYNMAAYAATKLKGVPVVEFGNEYDLDSHNARIANDGVNVSDYDNTYWPVWRGALRGSYDGWRSVDTTGQTKVIATASAGFLYLGWYKGMLTGVQPDGSSGHPKVKTDIIQLHWYSDGLDPENTWGKDGTNYNVLKILHDAYNLPIMFTEIGVNYDYSVAQAQAYIAKTIPELYAAKSTYNVVGFQWYELYDDPTGTYGILTNSGAKKAIYSSMKAAVAASH